MHIYWLYTILIIAIINGFNFSIAKIKNDLRWLDILWPWNFVGVGVLLIHHNLVESQSYPSQHFVVIFLTLWAVRQTRYLFKRQKRFLLSTRHEKDNQMPENRLKYYLKEVLLTYALALMVIVILAYPNETSFLRNLGLFVGSVVFLLGYIVEILSDQQLRTFKYRLEMEGRILKTGLWQFTRHPNYFGEVLIWVGLFIIVFTNSNSPYQFIAILSPLVMLIYTLTSRRIKNNERHLNNNEEYITYQNKTNQFFPWI